MLKRFTVLIFILAVLSASSSQAQILRGVMASSAGVACTPNTITIDTQPTLALTVGGATGTAGTAHSTKTPGGLPYTAASSDNTGVLTVNTTTGVTTAVVAGTAHIDWNEGAGGIYCAASQYASSTITVSGASTTYFGSNVNSSTGQIISAVSEDDDENSTVLWNIDTILPFICPGSGSKTVVDLSAYLKALNSGSFSIRMSIYSADRSTLIGQGSSAVSYSTGSFGWVSHTTFSPSTITLTGGTHYTIVLAFQNNDNSAWGYTTGTANSIKLDTSLTVWTTGYGSYTIPTGSSLTPNTEVPTLRCGVQ